MREQYLYYSNGPYQYQPGNRMYMYTTPRRFKHLKSLVLRWELDFNLSKCEIFHIGRNHPQSDYYHLHQDDHRLIYSHFRK